MKFFTKRVDTQKKICYIELAIKKDKKLFTKKDEQFYKQLRNVGALTGIGTLFFASVVTGYFIGNFLDQKFGTEPWCVLIFVSLGFTAAFVELWRLAKNTLP